MHPIWFGYLSLSVCVRHCVCVCMPNHTSSLHVGTNCVEDLYQSQYTAIPERIFFLCVCVCVCANSSLISQAEFTLLLSGGVLNMSVSIWLASCCQLQPRRVWWRGESEFKGERIYFFCRVFSHQQEQTTGTNLTLSSWKVKRCLTPVNWLLFLMLIFPIEDNGLIRPYQILRLYSTVR